MNLFNHIKISTIKKIISLLTTISWTIRIPLSKTKIIIILIIKTKGKINSQIILVFFLQDKRNHIRHKHLDSKKANIINYLHFKQIQWHLQFHSHSSVNQFQAKNKVKLFRLSLITPDSHMHSHHITIHLINLRVSIKKWKNGFKNQDKDNFGVGLIKWIA